MSEGGLLDEAILAPIAGGDPSGKDPTYDPTFEKLAAEIEKVTSVEGVAPDWGLVREESARLLKESAKDMRLASWWVASAGVVDGWVGVSTAAATYQALLERFWDGMFPPLKRARARAGLAGWLWEQLAKSLASRAVTIADGDAVRAFEAAILAIDGALNERVGDANPGLGPLRSLVREKIRSIPEPEKATDPFAAPSPSPAGAPASPSAPTRLPDAVAAPALPSVASLEAAENAAVGWRAPLSNLAALAREASPMSAWPYRLARVAAWLTLEVAPEADGGKTFARAPKASERGAFEGMFEASAWENLRNASEDALQEHILWLDLHRWSAIALERLGPPFVAAREAVGRETAALVARIPALPSLLFSNGTPFASPETIDWLAGEGARFGGGGGGQGRSATPVDDASRALLADAEARIAAGQVDDGLAQAISLANNAASASMRFRAQLAAVGMAHRAGKGELALALVERLLPLVDSTLEAWEPQVCSDFFQTALKVLRAELPDSGDRQGLLFRRLLQVDPAAALRIG